MTRLLPTLALAVAVASAAPALAAPASQPSGSAVLASFGFDDNSVTLLADPDAGVLAVRPQYVSADDHLASLAALHDGKAHAQLSAYTLPKDKASRTVFYASREEHELDGPDAADKWHAAAMAAIQRVGRAQTSVKGWRDGALEIVYDAPNKNTIIAVVRDDWIAKDFDGAVLRGADVLANAMPRLTKIHQVPFAKPVKETPAHVAWREQAQRDLADAAESLAPASSTSSWSTAAAAKDPKLAALLASVSKSALQADIAYMSGEGGGSNFFSRHSSAADYKRSADWMAAQMKALGCDTVEQQSFKSGYGNNIVCTIRGKTLPSEQVVLGGHLDSRAQQMVASERAPGANDNGSGSALLLASLRALNASSYKGNLKRTLKVIAFCGEEQGLVGSRAYAAKAKQRGDKIKMMLQADMIAYKKESDPIQLGIPDRYATPGANNLVRAVASTYVPELKVGITKACCSDHQAFYEQGYEATHFFEKIGNGVADPNYHTTRDTFKRGGFSVDQVLAHTRVALGAAVTALNQ